MKEPKLRRLLTSCRADGDERVTHVDVTDIPFEAIRAIVPPGANDPLLYDCYKLGVEQLAALQEFVKEDLDLPSIDYYLEAEADSKGCCSSFPIDNEGRHFTQRPQAAK
jgi:hypothetical protein